jgi:hypothetical protein
MQTVSTPEHTNPFKNANTPYQSTDHKFMLISIQHQHSSEEKEMIF